VPQPATFSTRKPALVKIPKLAHNNLRDQETAKGPFRSTCYCQSYHSTFSKCWTSCRKAVD